MVINPVILHIPSPLQRPLPSSSRSSLQLAILLVISQCFTHISTMISTRILVIINKQQMSARKDSYASSQSPRTSWSRHTTYQHRCQRLYGHNCNHQYHQPHHDDVHSGRLAIIIKLCQNHPPLHRRTATSGMAAGLRREGNNGGEPTLLPCTQSTHQRARALASCARR